MEDRRMAVVRSFCSALAATILVALPLTAQGVGAVRGRVVDSASQQPLTSVVVTVEGTQRGALSREDGTFDISGVPEGAQSIRLRRIGFHTKSVPVTVAAGGTANVDVALSAQA